ncbi:hypothetical protein [Actinoplanes solisilvae]|uniref:hypothetical protein n=1 Tax=Actinoplanes solisilvae TaxID=2486853 RepID=UPI000FD873F6|nr:hypothetical protein [Actinoplanes solisilvae]
MPTGELHHQEWPAAGMVHFFCVLFDISGIDVEGRGGREGTTEREQESRPEQVVIRLRSEFAQHGFIGRRLKAAQVTP